MSALPTRRALPRALLIVAIAAALCALAGRAQPARAQAASSRWHTFTSDNGLAGNIVQTIWEDPRGAVWFGTENGASRYDGRAWTTYRAAPDALVDNNVWAISGDAEAVWFATSNGLSRLQGEQWTRYSTADGLANNDVRAVLVARDGVVWAGMFGGGIARKAPGEARWQTVEVSQAIASRNLIVSAIWQAPGGALWFCTNGFGALRLDGRGWERFNFREASRNTVWSISAADGAGDTWVASFRGVARIHGDDSVDVVDTLAQGVPISATEVLAVAAERPDSIWLGTRANGVLHRSGEGWERFEIGDGLGRNYVQSIAVDRGGRVWFGTRGGGVTLLDPRDPQDAWGALRATVRARDIKHDAEIALDRPALRFDQNNVQFSFSAAVAWLPAQAVSFRYWLSRAGGADTPTKTVTSAAGPEPRATSDVQDFLNLPPGSYTLHVVPLVGVVAGVEDRYPFTIRGAPPAFSPDALRVDADGANVPSGATLGPAFFASARQVRLAFAASDDAPPEQIHYEYRLDGDAGWTRATGDTATLTLPQGAYHITARAVDAEGNASAPIALTVIVPGPFWITVLLYLGLLIAPAAAGGAAGAFWYRRWSQRQALLRAVQGQHIPYDVGPLIIAPERYIGRRHVLDAILGQIDHNSFYIYGEKRIGKTSLLAQIRQRLHQRNALQAGRLYIPVFRNIQDLPQEQFWLALMRGIADAADVAAPLAADRAEASYNDFDAEDDLAAIVAELRGRAAPRVPLFVLLLDEIDTLQRYDPIIRQRFRAFCQHVQGHMQVVLVGVRPPQAEAGETSPWYNIFAPLALEPLAAPDALFLIRSYNQNPYAYTPEAEQALIAAGDRKPFDTQWLCAESVRSMLAARRTRVTLADVEGAVRAVAGERRREYATFWQHAPAQTQADLRAALRDGGKLPPDRMALGDYDRLFEAGLALKTPEGARLAALFQHWLEESA